MRRPKGVRIRIPRPAPLWWIPWGAWALAGTVRVLVYMTMVCIVLMLVTVHVDAYFDRQQPLPELEPKRKIPKLCTRTEYMRGAAACELTRRGEVPDDMTELVAMLCRDFQYCEFWCCSDGEIP